MNRIQQLLLFLLVSAMHNNLISMESIFFTETNELIRTLEQFKSVLHNKTYTIEKLIEENLVMPSAIEEYIQKEDLGLSQVEDTQGSCLSCYGYRKEPMKFERAQLFINYRSDNREFYNSLVAAVADKLQNPTNETAELPLARQVYFNKTEDNRNFYKKCNLMFSVINLSIFATAVTITTALGISLRLCH